MNKLLSIVTLTLVSCFLHAQDQAKLHLKGHLSDLDKNDKVSLNLDGTTTIELDLSDNGDFDTHLILPQTGSTVFMYVTGPKGFRYTQFFLGNESVEINASSLDLSGDLRAKGSVMDSIRYDQYILNQKWNKKHIELNTQYEIAQTTSNNLDSLFNDFSLKQELLNKEVNLANFEFFKKNINSAYGIYMLKYWIANLDRQQSSELLALVNQQNQNRVEVEFLKAYASYPALENKDLYYDFVALDTNANPVYFRDQFDGRYVVLEFAKPSCPVSLALSDKINKLSKELAQRVNVFSVMPENNQKDLKEFKAMRLDSDMVYYTPKGHLDPALAKYNQVATPTYFVFSPQGELIFHGVGNSTTDLQGFLEKHIKQNNL